MLAARLRHRVTLQQIVQTRDSDGAVIEDWDDLIVGLPAEVWPQSGREFVAAQAVQAGVTTRITIRATAAVKAKMRILHEGAAYNIKAVLPDPTFARHLTLVCETGVTDG